jgi:putative component of toxin-antitoxin plasmid stabilization module
VEASEKRVEYYVTSDGKAPFREWFAALRDRKAQARVDARLRVYSLAILANVIRWVKASWS